MSDVNFLQCVYLYTYLVGQCHNSLFLLVQAEEITLTIGQAFDLAYKRFLEKKDSQQDQQKQNTLLQQQVSGDCL